MTNTGLESEWEEEDEQGRRGGDSHDEAPRLSVIDAPSHDLPRIVDAGGVRENPAGVWREKVVEVKGLAVLIEPSEFVVHDQGAANDLAEVVDVRSPGIDRTEDVDLLYTVIAVPVERAVATCEQRADTDDLSIVIDACGLGTSS